jgi:hypothetical protein
MIAHADNSIFKMSRCRNVIFWTRRNEWGEHPMKKFLLRIGWGATVFNFGVQSWDFLGCDS